MAAIIASGFGSILANELGKLAINNAPVLRDIARDTAVKVAKRVVDDVLDNNPNLASFMGHFGFQGFGSERHSKSTLYKRAKRRTIGGTLNR
jgi:hypothetical protein